MRAYSLDLRQRVMAAVEAGRPLEEVARLFGLSRATINRYRRRQRAGDDLAPGQSSGRPRHVSRADEPALEDQLAAHTDATLAQHCQRWADEQGVVISVATMRRAIRRLGWTRKKSRWQPASATRPPASSGAMMSVSST